MKTIVALLAILGAFVGDVYLGAHDMLAIMVAPGQESGITSAVLKLVGPPFLTPASQPTSGSGNETQEPSGPSVSDLSITVDHVSINAVELLEAIVTVTNNGAGAFSSVRIQCECADEKDGTFNLASNYIYDLPPHGKQKTDVTCTARPRGRKPSMSCSIDRAR